MTITRSTQPFIDTSGGAADNRFSVVLDALLDRAARALVSMWPEADAVIRLGPGDCTGGAWLVVADGERGRSGSEVGIVAGCMWSLPDGSPLPDTRGDYAAWQAAWQVRVPSRTFLSVVLSALVANDRNSHTRAVTSIAEAVEVLRRHAPGSLPLLTQRALER